MTKKLPRKVDLTLEERVHTAQNAWNLFRRRAVICVLSCRPGLLWARENEADFLTYCERHGVTGETHETRAPELLLAADSDADAISRERRAEYGNCIGWFADHELCPETDPDKAVALARQKGRITGIAQEYRDTKDANNPKAKGAKLKGQVTKKARRQGSENNVSQAASAAAARVLAEQMDSQPTTISRTREAGRDFCAAAGNSDAMLAFMSRHGIPAGVKHELDDDHHVQIYLRVRNSTEKQFQLFGPALDPDFADNLADIIVREHNEHAPQIAEVE